MPPEGYRSVSIPEKMIEDIEKLIETHASGYASVTEFVKDAIRRRIEQVQDLRSWGIDAGLAREGRPQE